MRSMRAIGIGACLFVVVCLAGATYGANRLLLEARRLDLAAASSSYRHADCRTAQSSLRSGTTGFLLFGAHPVPTQELQRAVTECRELAEADRLLASGAVGPAFRRYYAFAALRTLSPLIETATARVRSSLLSTARSVDRPDRALCNDVNSALSREFTDGRNAVLAPLFLRCAVVLEASKDVNDAWIAYALCLHLRETFPGDTWEVRSRPVLARVEDRLSL